MLTVTVWFRTLGDRHCTSQAIEENTFLLRTFASVCNLLAKFQPLADNVANVTLADLCWWEWHELWSRGIIVSIALARDYFKLFVAFCFTSFSRQVKQGPGVQDVFLAIIFWFSIFPGLFILNAKSCVLRVETVTRIHRWNVVFFKLFFQVFHF